MNDTTALEHDHRNRARQPRRRREAGHHARRARHRDRQRFGRRRAALRAVLRRDRGAHGQRHLDRRDHTRRDPAARAQHRRRERQPDPHRFPPRHQRRQRSRPGGRLQRAGAARTRARTGVEAGLHHPAGEHVAQPPGREDRRGLPRDLRAAGQGRLRRPGNPDGARVQGARLRSAPRQEHVRARDALQSLQPRPAARPGADRLHLRQEGR